MMINYFRCKILAPLNYTIHYIKIVNTVIIVTSLHKNNLSEKMDFVRPNHSAHLFKTKIAYSQRN